MKRNLIVPGFAKCGTSSLHEYLSMHPQVCMAKRKEPHYFSKSEVYSKGAEWYDSLFDQEFEDAKVFGESSTTYSIWEPALVRIKKELNNPKLILLVREPVERTLSHYRWMYSLGLEKGTLRQAIEAEKHSIIHPDFSRSGCYPWYLRASNYSHFIPLMEMIFGVENILMIRSSQLKDDPQLVLNHCWDFLGCTRIDLSEEPVVLNTTASKRIHRASKIRKFLQFAPPVIRRPLKLLKQSVPQAILTKKLVAPEPDESTLKLVNDALVNDRAFFDKISTLGE